MSDKPVPASPPAAGAPGAAAAAAQVPSAPVRAWLPVVALAWIVPGGGHFLLGRRWRGVLLLSSVLVMFAFGLMMRGVMFSPQSDGMGRFDLFTAIINWGGFIGNLASGVPYLLSMMLGYSQPDMAGHVHDYGTKFLVSAGLLNILAMVDAYEIATGKKN